MNYAGLAVEAPFLKNITLAEIGEFLKKRTEYLFNIGKVKESLDDDSKIVPTSLVASVDNDLLATIRTTGLEIAADELEDQVLQQYLGGFLQALRERSAGRCRSILRRSSTICRSRPYFSCSRSARNTGGP